MTPIQKQVRHYYWLTETFVKKNSKLILVSFVGSFFLIIILINFFPFFNNILFKKKEVRGIIGKFNTKNIPIEITSLISNPLITINENGELVPILASSWEILSNNKTYRFHLKPDLYWNNGDKFTAHDINYQFDGVKNNVIDANTIEFILNKPLSIFPVYLTKPIIKDVLQGVAGLYELQDYRVQKNTFSVISLSPNRSNLPSKTFKFFSTEDDLIRAYKKGEITIIETSKKTVALFFKNWKNTKITRGVNYNQILTVFFNTERKSLESKEIRKAIVYATPKFSDFGDEARGPLPPASWAYSTNIKRYSTDLDKAASLIKKNLSASESASLELVTFYDYITIAEAIKTNLEKIGFKITVKILSYIPQDFDMFITMWNPPVDPDQYYFWHSTQKEQNITNYKNVKVDKLLEDGRKIIDIQKRRQIYEEFQQIIVEEVPAYFLYHPFVYTIARK